MQRPERWAVDGRGQQEVYVVMRGAARFVIDGTEIEAPAGVIQVVATPRQQLGSRRD
jgi:mannose-6-phosphate isomerase-like protein (cupin superfamily)